MLNSKLVKLLEGKRASGKFTLEDSGKMYTVKFDRVAEDLMIFADKKAFDKIGIVKGQISVRCYFLYNGVEYSKDYSIKVPAAVEQELLTAKLLGIEPDFSKVTLEADTSSDSLTYAISEMMKEAKLPLTNPLTDLQTLETNKPELRLSIVKDPGGEFNGNTPYAKWVWGEKIQSAETKAKKSMAPAAAAKLMKGGRK